MASLTREQRNLLAKTTLEAREVAERGAAKALEVLGVGSPKPHSNSKADERELRVALRAQAIQLGDERNRNTGAFDNLQHLIEKIAYDQYHRMLFARFLAENNLLISPEHGVSVSMEDCRDLAMEIGKGDQWQVAAEFAAAMLPQIFRVDDSAGQISLAPEDRNKLKQIVIEMPREIFLADDSLGWVYQYWQAKRKDEINKSEKKIGADELAPVTQLFTEDYMVSFLLHNTLGAWWVAKRKAEGKDERLPRIEFTYLRRNDDGSPAAGSYDGWPRTAKELRILDPSMGSGHFLVFSLPIMVAMRMEEEGLPQADAIKSVISDNLFGLEIDPRCTQIAAFNLALVSWKMAGCRKLPPLNLACCGLAIHATEEQWRRLANGDERLANGMSQLYHLFRQAPTLGSLIDPRQPVAGDKVKAKASGDLLIAEYRDLQPLLVKALEKEKVKQDFDLHEIGVVAQGLVQAAEIMARSFHLVTTNVPYLGRRKQDAILKQFCERNYLEAKADLATCFLQRSLVLCGRGGTAALVTPQYWLFQGSYKDLRMKVLNASTLIALAILGPRCFETISGEVVNATLFVSTNANPSADSHFFGIDVSREADPSTKAMGVINSEITTLLQMALKQNPDNRITTAPPSNLPSLSKYAKVFVGFQNGDTPRWVHYFWEHEAIDAEWEVFHATPDQPGNYEGIDSVLRWDSGKGELARSEQVYVKGREAWGHLGVLCRQTQPWPTSLYLGTLYDQSSSVLVPISADLLSPLYCFLQSDDFRESMLKIANTMKFTNSTFVKVPFDLNHWRQMSKEIFPLGLPKPSSNDPSQCMFGGIPQCSGQPLAVAMCRLLGYKWPRQTGFELPDCPAISSDSLEKVTDEDGIVCINSIKGEQPAAERLRGLLSCAFGSDWSNDKQNELLSQAGFKGKSLEDWLRNGFFEQHCKLFHQRPFIWHIWDGRKDGFSALVNCHKLDYANLQKLIYTYLGDWIQRQKSAQEKGEEGSDGRLAAALDLKKRLELILEGEAPYDIFVRWKKLVDQPIGWNPDLNDGVRLNIRPFITANVLRVRPKIDWKKDRGKDVESAPWYNKYDPKRAPDYKPGDRINDYHLTLEEKRRSREGK